MTMPLEQVLLIALCAAVAVLLVLVVVLLVRGRAGEVAERLTALKMDNERLERALREEQRGGRQELAAAFGDFRQQVEQQLGTVSGHQRERMEQFALQLRHSLGDLGERNDKRLGEMRATLDSQLKSLQQDNSLQLEKMRATVDEKLQKTLEDRLGHSFKLVSERLEAVQRGLGEMQELASGVGDLKRVLGNVKTRGTFGEAQLGALLEQILVSEQYQANVATVAGSNERVEYAIRMPGPDRDGQVWLPIDAKFPREDYERLLDAQDKADTVAAAAAGDALERRIRDEAGKIRDKYVAPPQTTDFAVMYLPTEGLYAEVVRRPGLFEDLQRHQHVTVAGPTTLTAILNALQMGFRTLAIEQRSSEVWQLLGAVKTEFGKFGGVLERTRKQLDTVRNSIHSAGVRTRAIERKLRGVESLPGESAKELLEDLPDLASDEEDGEGEDQV